MAREQEGFRVGAREQETSGAGEGMNWGGAAGISGRHLGQRGSSEGIMEGVVGTIST